MHHVSLYPRTQTEEIIAKYLYIYIYLYKKYKIKNRIDLGNEEIHWRTLFRLISDRFLNNRRVIIVSMVSMYTGFSVNVSLYRKKKKILFVNIRFVSENTIRERFSYCVVKHLYNNNNYYYYYLYGDGENIIGHLLIADSDIEE